MADDNPEIEQDSINQETVPTQTDQESKVAETTEATQQDEQNASNAPRNLSKLVIFATVIALLIISVVIWYPESHISQVRTALLEHNLELAKTHLDKLQAFPLRNKAEVHFLTARLERRRGDYDQMNAYLELAQAEGYDPVRIQRERILAAAQAANLEVAQPKLPELLNDPRGDEREICEAYIIGYLQFQQHEAALQLADAWQNDFPEDARPHFLEGVIQKSLFNYKQSEEAYRRALEINPKYYQAALDIADVLLTLKDTERAIQYLKMAEDDPNFRVDSYTAQAHCLRMLGRDEQAEQILRIVTKEYPEHIAAGIELGRILIETNRPKEGIEVLEPIIDKDPRNTDGRHMLAMGLRSLGELNKAQEHFDYVEKVKENLADANQIAQRIGSGKDSIDQRLIIAEKFWTYGSEQEAMIWMRSAYQLDPLYLPTLKFMKQYYEVKIKEDPNLQQQLDRFTTEVEKAEARLQQGAVPAIIEAEDTAEESNTTNSP
ncbi:MAG: tetratricopeptide repeat protein [Planctomycetota bacterium]|nr:tetratricopeptide repeat protein [Planctomycetota bacterium]